MTEDELHHGSSAGASSTSGSARRRPLGITALALLSGSLSLLILVGGVLILATSTSSFTGETLFMGMVLFLLLAALYAACAVGLWRLQNWARWASILICAFLGVRRFPIAAIVALPVVIYLVNPRTASAFRTAATTGTEDAS